MQKPEHPEHRRRRIAPLAFTVVVLVLAGSALTSRAVAGVRTEGCANTTSCTLAELLAGGAVIAGGQRFDGFRLEHDPGTLDPTSVEVTGLDDAGLVPGPGLRFVFAGSGLARNTGTDLFDLRTSHRVRSTIPGWSPTGRQRTLAAYDLDGVPWIESDEALFDDQLRLAGAGRLQVDPGFGEIRPSDSFHFEPRTSLVVSSRLRLTGRAEGDAAAVHEIEERVALVVVPEPTFTSMFAAGLALLTRSFVRSSTRRAARSRKGSKGDPDRRRRLVPQGDLR